MTPNGVFPTGDDELAYISVVNDTQFQRLCAVIDREDLTTEEKFADADARWDHQEELYETLVAAFEEYDRETLVEQVAEAGVPAGPVNEVGDVITDDHVAVRDMLTESRNLTAGESVETAGVPFVTRDGRPEMCGEPPEAGEHTRAVLAELGYSEKRIDRMLEAGAAIE